MNTNEDEGVVPSFVLVRAIRGSLPRAICGRALRHMIA